MNGPFYCYADGRTLQILYWHTHTYTHPLDGRLLCLSIHVHGTHWKNQHAARHSATGNDIHRCLDDWPSRPPPFGLFNSVGVRTEWEGNVAQPANFHSTNFQIQPPNNVSRYWYYFAPVRFICWIYVCVWPSVAVTWARHSECMGNLTNQLPWTFSTIFIYFGQE